MSKNILIRNLTEEQNSRLQQLQGKFGVKTNSQALLMLLRYCVITDDEITNLVDLYSQFGTLVFGAAQKMEQLGQNEVHNEFMKLVNFSISLTKKLEYLQSVRRGK
jgi:hypothetical protein